MIVDKIYKFKPEIQQVGKYPSTLGWNLNQDDRLQVSSNIHELINNLFCFGGGIIKFKNYIEHKDRKKLLSDAVFNFEPGLNYFDAINEKSVVIDKGLIEFFKEVYGKKGYFQDWINRVFYKIDSQKLGSFSLDEIGEDEMDLLTYDFALKVLIQSVIQNNFVGKDKYIKFDTITSFVSDIVFRHSNSLHYFTKSNGIVCQTQTIFNFDWELISKYFFGFLDQYKIDYDVVYEFLETGIKSYDIITDVNKPWKYIIKNKLKHEGNLLFMYIIYKLFEVQETGLLETASLLFSEDTTNVLLQKELTTLVPRFSKILDTQEYKMFLISLEIILLYYTTYFVFQQDINPMMMIRGILGTRNGYKFFNKGYYDILEKLKPKNGKKENLMLDRLKNVNTRTQCRYTQEEYYEKQGWAIRITSNGEEGLSPIAGYQFSFSVYPKQDVLDKEKIEGDRKEDSFEEYTFDERKEEQEQIMGEGNNEENVGKVSLSQSEEKNTLQKGKITSQLIYEKLKEEIVGQDGVLKVISKKLYSYLVLKKTNNTPLSLFLVGPSGSGKSYLSSVIVKVLNELFFNSEDVENKFVAQEELISKYNTKETISSLLGSPTGYQGSKDKIPFFETLFESKNQIILFDEMEKGSQEMFRFFLDFMNNGKMESISKKYGILMGDSEFELKTENIQHLDNVIFIFASNAIISEENASKLSDKKYKNCKSEQEYEDNFSYNNHVLYNALVNYRSQSGGIIDPAFIDRLDSIYLFNELTEENKLSILKKKFLKELQNYNISEQGKEIVISFFEKDFKKGGKGYEDMGHYESMRGFNRYIGDWISTTIEKNEIN